uniref:Phosphodiesterase n=1 Tax=Macrostomum lignano TaxID=282301 RepID=A0A1I8F9G3_9PLAT
PGGIAGSFADNHLAEKTLKDLEWCLEQLEAVQTHRSVADMASSKFKKMLKIELERMSSWPSSTGATSNQIESYITSTFLELHRCWPLPLLPSPPRGNPWSRRRNSTSGTLPDTQRSPASAPLSSPAEASGARGTMTKVPVRPAVLPPTPTEGRCRRDSAWRRRTPSSSASCSRRAWASGGWTSSWWTGCPASIRWSPWCTPSRRNATSSTSSASTPATLVNYSCTWSSTTSRTTPTTTPCTLRRHQSTHVLLNAQALDNVFSDLGILASIFACAIHDVNHPGVTNQFLINTERAPSCTTTRRAARITTAPVAFQAAAGAEQQHPAPAGGMDSGAAPQMVIDMVLATDMSKHMSLLADLKTMVETKKVAGGCLLKLDNYSEKMQIMQNMVHCATQQTRQAHALSSQWVTRVMEEFFSQGDREKALGLPVSPMCCRETANVEMSFIDFIVHPLWEAWTELVHPDAEHILNTLEGNRDHYSDLSAAKEAAAAAKAGQET